MNKKKTRHSQYRSKYRSKKNTHMFYKLAYASTFVLAAIIAACLLVYFFPSLPQKSTGAFRWTVEACGRWVDSSRQNLGEWWHALTDASQEDEVALMANRTISGNKDGIFGNNGGGDPADHEDENNASGIDESGADKTGDGDSDHDNTDDSNLNNDNPDGDNFDNSNPAEDNFDDGNPEIDDSDNSQDNNSGTDDSSNDTPNESPPVQADTFSPSNEVGSAPELDNFDVPEDISSYYIMLDTAMGPMIYYNQGDSRWADHPCGKNDPIKQYGCGPTAVSMLISSFSLEGGGLSPVEVADWATEHNLYASGGGSYHTLVENAMNNYGLHVESVKNRTVQQASELLESGHILVALVKPGTLTRSSGHFILITKLLDNGNVWIADPGSYRNTQKEWKLDMLLSELKVGAGGGGPLWAVSSAE